MTGSQAAVAGATVAVFVGGRRTGSAVLVAPRYLVTAAHMLLRRDPGTLAKVPVDQVELEFPGRGPGGQAGRATALRLDLGPASPGVDVAVLDLGEDPPSWLPAPVPVWPAARVPARVKVFGYPLAEGPLNGVWRQFMVAGPATAGAMQLDWIADAGTFPGHSGGPVVDLIGHRLAGILVQGSETGRFDRFLPVTLIAQVWPSLPRGWLMAGAGQAEEGDHFHPRALGQRGLASEEDLFRGRDAALAAVRGWLTAAQPPGRPLVITGQPGAGKSAVLARAVLQLEADRTQSGLAFHGRDASHADLLYAVADLTGVDRCGSAGGLIKALRDHRVGPWLVAMDALDEVATTADRRQIVELLMNLAALPGLRVAVATRPLAAGRDDRYRYGPDALLPTLGITSAGSASLVDLDTDPYFDPAGVRDYAALLLMQVGADPGIPPGGGWNRYRADSQLRDRLAALVAGRADRNYLVAALAAEWLSRDAVVDPAAPGFDPGLIPASVGEALDKYLDGLVPRQKVRVRGLLTALAYARGTGIEDRIWLAFATVLGYQVSVEDLDELRDSAAVDYLLQTTRTADPRPVTRVFHQALTEELLYGRDRPGDENLLVDVLLTEATRTGWQAVYLCEHAAEHAAAADRLDELLEDPVYLAKADPDRLLRALPAATPSPAKRLLQRMGSRLPGRPVEERAAVLELGARQLGARWIADRLAELPPGGRPWSVRWAHEHPVGHDRILGWHDGPVLAVAVGKKDGRAVVVSGGSDGVIRVWDLRTGGLEREWRHGEGRVETVAIGGSAADPVVVSGGEDGKLQRWRLADDPPRGEPLATPPYGGWGKPGGSGKITSAAVGDLAGQQFIVAAYEAGGTVGLWDLDTGQPLGVLEWGSHFPPHEYLSAHVNAVAAGRCNRGPVIVAGHSKGAHRWLRDGGKWVAERLISEHETTWAVALGVLGERPVAVCGVDDRLTTLYLESGQRAIPSYESPDGYIIGVATGKVDGRTVAVSGSYFGSAPGNLRVWDLTDENQPLKGSLVGHYGGSKALAITRLGDRAVLVSGGFDHAVGVWDLAASLDRMPDRVEHQTIEWLQACELGGRPVVVSKSFASVSFSKSWVWHKKVNEDLEDHRKSGDRSFLISHGSTVERQREDTEASWKPVIRVWDQVDGTPIDARSLDLDHLGDLCAIGRVGDTVLGVSVDDPRWPKRFGAREKSTHLRVRDLRSGAQVGRPIPVSGDVRDPIAIGGLGDLPVVVFCDARDSPATMSLLKDNWLQVWDVRAGRLCWEPLPAYQDVRGRTSALSAALPGSQSRLSPRWAGLGSGTCNVVS